MNKEAVLDRPDESLTLTTKVFVLASEVDGVPEMPPLDETASHAGPLTFANVKASNGFGSEALVAMVPV